MTYIKDTLTQGENVTYTVNYFWLYKFEIVLYFIVAFIGLFWSIEGGVILACIGIYRYLVVTTTERVITNLRIIQKKGIISRNTDEIKFNNIETVTVHQSVLDRLLDTGIVQITGKGGITIHLDFIDNPIEVKREIEKIYLK